MDASSVFSPHTGAEQVLTDDRRYWVSADARARASFEEWLVFDAGGSFDVSRVDLRFFGSDACTQPKDCVLLSSASFDGPWSRELSFTTLRSGVGWQG